MKDVNPLSASEVLEINGGDDNDLALTLIYGIGFGAGLLASGPLLITAAGVGAALLWYDF